MYKICRSEKKTVFNNLKGTLIHDRNLKALNDSLINYRQKDKIAVLQETASMLVLISYWLGARIILWTLVFWHNTAGLLVSQNRFTSVDVWILMNWKALAGKLCPEQLLVNKSFTDRNVVGVLHICYFQFRVRYIFPHTYRHN